MNRKNLSLTLAIGIASLTQTPFLKAQNSETAVVPFDYQVGTAKLSSGQVTVSRVNRIGISDVRDENGTHVFFTGRVPKDGKGGDAKLVFHRYGNKYFLAEVWFPGDAYGHAAIPSHREKEMALNTKADTVEVAFAMAP